MANHFILCVHKRISIEITVVSGDKLQASTLTVLSNYTLKKKKTNDEKFRVPHNFFENQLKISR